MAIYSSPQASAATTLTGNAGKEVWICWPGGHTSPALNPTEEFSCGDFDFVGNVDWDVSTGVIPGVIVEADAVTGLNVTSITAQRIVVRYDSVSSSGAEADAAIIKATQGIDVKSKKRTVFKISYDSFNGNAVVHAKNKLRYDKTYFGIVDFDKAGPVFPSAVNKAKNMGVKVEVIFKIAPADIKWTASGIAFSSANDKNTGRPAVAVKGSCVARRTAQKAAGLQKTTDLNRGTMEAPMSNDGRADPTDVQYPSDATPDYLFRIDIPSFPVTGIKQSYMRGNFEEFVDFYNGKIWSRISDIGTWNVNVTGALPNCTPVNPNYAAIGTTTENIPNTPPVFQAVGVQNVNATPGQEIELTYPATDAENDMVAYLWSFVSGTSPVALTSLVPNLNTKVKVKLANGTPPFQTILQVVAVDSISQRVFRNTPPNSTSAPLTIQINVA